MVGGRHPALVLVCLALGALSLGILAPACATHGDVEDLMAEHRALRERQDAQQQQLDAIQQTLDRLAGVVQAMRADLSADLRALRTDMGAVQNAVRGAETRLEQMRSYTPPVESTPDDSTGASAVSPTDQLTLYRDALGDYQQGRLELARQGLEEYLVNFPRGASAADAQYWLGMVSFDQERYDAAITALRVVPRAFPESPKAPLALRKIGDAHRAAGDGLRAQAAYRELVQRYPDSAEADAARRELSSP
ncbi:MAG: tetratricopeptide repeat protein [Gemmatimonadota bacterium]